MYNEENEINGVDDDMNEVNEGLENENLDEASVNSQSGGKDKREAFKRIAARRMTEAIKKIQLIGNLSNRSSYDFEAKHVEKMIGTLEKEIEVLKVKFKAVEVEEEKDFSFED